MALGPVMALILSSAGASLTEVILLLSDSHQLNEASIIRQACILKLPQYADSSLTCFCLKSVPFLN